MGTKPSPLTYTTLHPYTWVSAFEVSCYPFFINLSPIIVMLALTASFVFCVHQITHEYWGELWSSHLLIRYAHPQQQFCLQNKIKWSTTSSPYSTSTVSIASPLSPSNFFLFNHCSLSPVTTCTNTTYTVKNS